MLSSNVGLKLCQSIKNYKCCHCPNVASLNHRLAVVLPDLIAVVTRHCWVQWYARDATHKCPRRRRYLVRSGRGRGKSFLIVIIIMIY